MPLVHRWLRILECLKWAGSDTGPDIFSINITIAATEMPRTECLRREGMGKW